MADAVANPQAVELGVGMTNSHSSWSVERWARWAARAWVYGNVPMVSPSGARVGKSLGVGNFEKIV